MRGLVPLITIMTTLIVIGLGLLVYGIVTQAGNLGGVREHSLALPADSAITHMAMDRGILALYVTTGDAKAIYLVDAKKAQVKSRIAVTTDVPE